MERGYSEGKEAGEVNKKGKYKQEKNESSNSGNTHINNLYSA